MARLQIKTNQRRLNMFEQGEQDVYVTSPVRGLRLTADELLDAASRNSGINKATIYSAMVAVENEFENFLMNGRSVTVPMLGTFRLSLSAKAVATQEEAGATAVYRRKVIYTPTTDIKRKIAAINLVQLPADIETSADDEPAEPEP